MKKTILLLSIIGFVFASCQKDENQPKDQNVVNSKLKSAIAESNNNFSLDIFKQLVTNDPSDKNVFISPTKHVLCTRNGWHWLRWNYPSGIP